MKRVLGSDNMSELNNELKLLENKRIRAIIDAAKVEFGINGIINTKLKDISKRAKVGEATLYRNFTDKTALVKLVAYDYWYEESLFFEKYLKENILESDSGLNKLVAFVSVFKISYNEHVEFLKFIEDVDNYMMKIENESRASGFEVMILKLKEYFISMVVEGMEDGSIRPGIDVEEAYALMSQVFIPVVQNLAIRVGYLQSDDGLDTEKLLNNLIQMFVCVIQNNQ